MLKAIINGIVVTESASTEETIIIKDDKILALIAPGEDPEKLYPGCEVIDAKGQYIVPGGVDGHVHFCGFGTIPIADDFTTGSKAALAGGTTTIVDFCQPEPDEGPMEALERCLKLGEKSAVDFALHFSFTERYESELPYLDKLQEAGITAFKMFTYYDARPFFPETCA